MPEQTRGVADMRRVVQSNVKASQGQRLTCTALIGQYACPNLSGTVANFLLLGKIHFSDSAGMARHRRVAEGAA